jgi:hypothetical protein
MLWVVLAAVALWLIVRTKKPRPTPHDVAASAREARIANDALAGYEWSDESADAKKSYHYRTLTFHFPKMLAFETEVSRYTGGEETRAFHLRRVDATKWQMKRVAENAAGEAAALKRDAERDSDSFIEEDLINELNGPQCWFDVEERAVASLETQYQRFLLHWRPLV